MKKKGIALVSESKELPTHHSKSEGEAQKPACRKVDLIVSA